MKDYVFDSFAMIAFFEDEPGANLVEQALRELFSKQARGWMSVINWGELYYCTCREQGVEMADRVLLQLASYPIEIVEADRVMTLEAARLKAKYRLAYADCFAAALASKKSALLITGDPEFAALSDKVEILWLPQALQGQGF
jgi:predicted nucleic acid-binding protein